MTARARTTDAIALSPRRLLRRESAGLPHIDKIKDRNGQYLYYFRKGKGSRIRLVGQPGTPEFATSYAAAMAGQKTADELAIRRAALTFVYFAIAGDTVKIGFSKDPMKRLASLKTGIAAGVQALVCIPGTQALERKLHAELSGERMTGEWFRNSAKTMAVVTAALDGSYSEGLV